MDDLTEKWGTELSPEIEVDFETTVIQLKTESGVNGWLIKFQNNMGYNVGNVKVDVYDMVFHIEGCKRDSVIPPDLVLAGDDDINIWTISRTLEPSRISMSVNGLEVFNFLPSADTCTNNQWQSYWGPTVTAKEFFFKSGDGGIIGYRMIDMQGNYKRAESLYTGTSAFFKAY